ncbi:MAG: CPBP family intramembrane metalloprotease [Bacteroidales bacterium]|jgi:membrane protease YdiL (CAAX protease family)|nr:CPBP family intramembrane metalloprotease [Bacteroidales bacterium]
MENIKKSYPNIIQSIGISGIMILASIVFSPLILLSNYIGKDAATFIFYVLAIGITFGIAYIIRRKVTGQRTFNLSIPNKRTLPFIIAGTIALAFGIASPIVELIPMPEFIKKALMDNFGGTGIFAFLLMVVAAPVFEELIFRGIILDGLLKQYSPMKSILLSALLFGIIHLNPWQFVTAVIIGVFAGWIYYKTRSLTLSVIIHATTNFGGFLSNFFTDESAMDQSSIEFYGGVTNFILATLAAIFMVCFCIFFLRKEFRKSNPTNFGNF